jgi:hypothetical protein
VARKKAARKAKKAGKPAPPAPKMSAAQYKSYLHYLQTHRSLDAARKTSGKVTKARAAVMPDWLAPSVAPGWVLGGNDSLDTCTLTAFANHQLIGFENRVTVEEIIAAGERLSIEEALAYVDEFGLGGRELRTYEKCSPDMRDKPGVILGLKTVYGPHTVVSLGRGFVVSWAQMIKLESAVPEEAWVLEWS